MRSFYQNNVLDDFIVIFSVVDISLAFSIIEDEKKNHFILLLKRILIAVAAAIIYTKNHCVGFSTSLAAIQKRERGIK